VDVFSLNVDVVVCAKNQAETLDAVLRQIVREVPFENLIVVYGSSKDQTREIAEKYTTKVFWDGDKGLGAARNLGVRKATSEIVAMVDADVILGKGWYKQLIEYFQDSAVAAVIGTCVYGYGCKPLESYAEYQRRTEVVYYGCQGTMFRRRAVLEVGNFKERIQGAGEDYDLYQRLLSVGYRWIWVREASVYHPMGMLEYLKHVRWWAKGKSYQDSAEVWVRKTSLVRAYGRQCLSMLEALCEAIKLAVIVHPTFLLYWPVIRLIQIVETLKGLKTSALAVS
jgi:glycosyltransferase involved in cell wall biosynthesis